MINRGRTHVPLVTSSISAAICGAISVVLVPRHGMLGAAVASTVAYIVSQAIAVYLFCRDSGVSPAAALFIDAQDFAFYGRLVRRLTLRFAH
jgi:Na+-driven multidrug efflux pump